MRVHLIKKQTVEDFVTDHANARNSFNNWLNTLKFADWDSTTDIRQTFKSADFLGNGTSRIVFDIGGNNYRMICSYHFGETEVHLYILWIGTHAEYTELCSNGSQYTIKQF